MKKLITIFTICFFAFLTHAFSQISCTVAFGQLQSYASQVNQIYANEYSQIIPNQRCPAFDQFGRPFDPRVVQGCRIQMLGFLNNWYAQQCNFVNSNYATLVRGCAVPTSPDDPPAPSVESGNQQSARIDTKQIKEVAAGVDDDKKVRITIPKTAEGFRPRN